MSQIAEHWRSALVFVQCQPARRALHAQPLPRHGWWALPHVFHAAITRCAFNAERGGLGAALAGRVWILRASSSTGAALAWVAFYVGGLVAALSGDWEYPISVLKTWGVAQVDAVVPVAVGATDVNVSNDTC